MLLSRHSIEILLDLLEIKVNALEVQDRDDARELKRLKKCRQELVYIYSQLLIKHKKKVIEPTPLRQRLYSKRYASSLD